MKIYLEKKVTPDWDVPSKPGTEKFYLHASTKKYRLPENWVNRFLSLMELRQLDAAMGMTFISHEIFAVKEEKEREFQNLFENFMVWRKKNRIRYWLTIAFSVR